MRPREKEKWLVKLRAVLQDPKLDINAQDKDRQGHSSTSLLHAVDHGHAQTVAELLKHPKIDPNAGSALTHFTPLLVAAENGSLAILKLLMAHQRCDPNLGSLLDGTTPLIHCAASKNTALAAELLCDPRVDVNSTNANGSSTLSICCQLGQFNIAQLVLAHADFRNINQRNSLGATPFSYLCQINGSDQLKMLEELFLPISGLDASLGNTENLVPLHLATCSGNVAALRLLLARPEIKINARDNVGASSLYKACEMNQCESLHELLACPGIDLTLGHIHDGGSAVNMASQFNHHQALKLLLQHDDAHKAINIPLKPHGATPLYMAVQGGFVESVKLLLAHPACDLNKACVDGLTPLEAACRVHLTGLVPSVNPRAKKPFTDGPHPPPRSLKERQIDIARLLMAHPSIDVSSSKGKCARAAIQALLMARGATL